MTNKKYLPSVIVLYLNYFLHGIGCSVLGQAVIKDALAGSWNVEAMAITAIAAALGLGRLIALPFAGPLSDKLGRRISTAIGGFAYAVYLIGLAMAFNAGGGAGYKIAYVCAIVGGIANSFLDTGIYPAVAEIINKAPGVATMGIKFAISASQMLLPFFLGVTVGTTAAGLRTGCPTFVMSFGGDQYFWGLQIAERGLGPKPVNIHSGKWTKDEIKKGLTELQNGKYSDNARMIGEILRAENGCKNAADVLENYFKR